MAEARKASLPPVVPQTAPAVWKPRGDAWVHRGCGRVLWSWNLTHRFYLPSRRANCRARLGLWASPRRAVIIIAECQGFFSRRRVFSRPGAVSEDAPATQLPAQPELRPAQEISKTSKKTFPPNPRQRQDTWFIGRAVQTCPTRTQDRDCRAINEWIEGKRKPFLIPVFTCAQSAIAPRRLRIDFGPGSITLPVPQVSA